MDTILGLPAIHIKYVSEKTEGEVYTAIIGGIVPALAVIAQDSTLLRLAEMELKEAVALVNMYQSRLAMNARIERENQKAAI